jgi:hypothetical protein
MQADQRVLYEGSSRRAGARICVTTHWCIVDEAEYPIAELDNLGQSRGSRDLLHVPGLVSLGLAAGLLIFVIVAIGRGWTAEIESALAVAVVGTVAVTFLPAALTRVLRRPYEIWAEYQGSPVYLFGTFDKEQFGQVSRALVRAKESTEQG